MQIECAIWSNPTASHHSCRLVYKPPLAHRSRHSAPPDLTSTHRYPLTAAFHLYNIDCIALHATRTTATYKHTSSSFTKTPTAPLSTHLRNRSRYRFSTTSTCSIGHSIQTGLDQTPYSDYLYIPLSPCRHLFDSFTMSSDNSNSNQNNNNDDMARTQRRGSVTASSAALASLFRSNSISQAQQTNFPGTSAAINEQRRRLSITTLGLSGTSPSASFMRRASLSTNNSELAEENAVEEDDSARTAPAIPFGRRMSLGGARGLGGVSPGTNGRPPPPTRLESTSLLGPPPTPPPVTTPGTGNYTWGRTPSQANIATPLKTPSDVLSPRSEQGFNWSEQLRSRAESAVSGQRPSFSFASGLGGSPPGAGFRRPSPPASAPQHDRAKSISEMPAPPAQAPKARPAPQKPDPFQERILKGDFYMD